MSLIKTEAVGHILIGLPPFRRLIFRHVAQDLDGWETRGEGGREGERL